MKVYLAAAWGRRAELLPVAAYLRSLGIEVTSNWLAELADTPVDPDFLRSRAEIDLADIDRADCLVRFSDVVLGSRVHISLLSCARMFEFGYAHRSGKRLYVVGGVQNIFDQLSSVIHVKTVNELYQRLVADSALFDAHDRTFEEAYNYE